MHSTPVTGHANLKGDPGTIESTWEPGDIRLARQRVTVDEKSRPARPQEPSGPYPYREEEARYRNTRADCDLAGTLTIPVGPGPFPAVLLISGSGKHDRNGSMCDHQPFLVLADYLTRRGIAVLRTDDRGVGESGGDFSEATTSDLTTDAEAAVAWLRTHAEVAPGRIGLIGHSEGGLIASMAAARDRGLAFIVLMAGPGIPGWEIAGNQARRQAELHGADGEAAGRLNTDLAAILRSETDLAAIRHELHQRLSGVAEERRARMVDHLSHPWMRHFVGLNPAEFLQRVECPVLALIGGKDAFLEPKTNLEIIRQALDAAGNRCFELVEIPGLNHQLQTCETGSPAEYAQIEETLAPVALDKIASWVGNLPAR